MKKIFILFLTIIISLSMSACGKFVSSKHWQLSFFFTIIVFYTKLPYLWQSIA